MSRTRMAAALAAALAAGAAMAVPVALVAAGHWDGPPLSELDLGAAGAREAGGRWLVESVQVDGEAVVLEDQAPIVLDLDTVTATLAGEAGCSPLLGSFTLGADGAASFTVPSARFERCPASSRVVEDGVRSALDAATSWRLDAERLVLDGPGAQMVLRPA